MNDDGSSHIVRFAATVQRPDGMRPCVDARLMELNAGAAWGMMDIATRFKIDPSGTKFHALPTPTEARRALMDWLHDIADQIERYDLEKACIDAVFPVPYGVDYNATLALWSSDSLPPYPVLVHVLFSIGLGPHVVTGAALLWHRAAHPLRAKTEDLIGHESSDDQRQAVKGT
jgi:hypothetical protein